MIGLKWILLVTLAAPATPAFSQATYDSESKEVVIRTPLLTKLDTGVLAVKAQDHVTVVAVGMDPQTKKLTQLCGRDPSLGLLFLDGKLTLDRQPPKVTETLPWGEKNQASIAAGYVHSYVLKGEAAKDLLDLLLTYEQVGFAPTASKCDETANLSSRGPTINFFTRGLERAMKRLP